MYHRITPLQHGVPKQPKERGRGILSAVGEGRGNENKCSSIKLLALLTSERANQKDFSPEEGLGPG